MRRKIPWANSIGLPVALMLLVSAYGHIDNSYAFLSSIYSYKLVPPAVGITLAAFIPFFQLTLGIALLFFASQRQAAFALSSILFLGFVGVQTSALIRDLNISCGCFGSSSTNPIGVKSISIAAIGLLLSLAGFLSQGFNKLSNPVKQESRE